MTDQRAAVIECDLSETQQKMSALADRMVAFANELIAPMLCTTPAYGVPGAIHCAACCYGTGIIVTCAEDQAIADAATALHKAASGIYCNIHADCCGRKRCLTNHGRRTNRGNTDKREPDMHNTWHVIERTEREGIVLVELQPVEWFKKNPEWEAHADEVGWDGDEFVEALPGDDDAEFIEVGKTIVLDLSDGPELHPGDDVKLTIDVFVHA